MPTAPDGRNARDRDAPARDVIVLGAGPAGLAAAWYAARRGLSVTVVDRAARVGGLAASIVVDDQSVDLGSHRLHPSIDAGLLDDLRSALHVELQWRPRNGRVRMMGRWLEFPLRAADVVRHAPPRLAGRALLDVAATPVRRVLGRRSTAAPDSFARQVRLGLGPTIAGSFYEPYAQKLWAVGADQLSAELFRRRVGTRSASSIVRTMVRPARPRSFWYPSRGFGEISMALARGVEEMGGEVALSTQVTSIDLHGDSAVLRLSGRDTIRAQTLVSTIPSADLVGLLGAPRDVIDSADALTTRAAVLVYLTIPRSRYTPFDAHYFPAPATVVSRLSEPKNYRESESDPFDRTVLCAEIPVTVGDALWSSGDDELARRVCAELVAEGLPEPAPSAVHLERVTNVYPVYRLGFEARRSIVDDHLDGERHLAVLGRQALFAHDNTHHSLLMGRAVAESLDEEGRLDIGGWKAARRAFADHVVED